MEKLTSGDKRVLITGSAIGTGVSFIGTIVLDEQLDGPISQKDNAYMARERANDLRARASYFNEAALDLEQNLGHSSATEYLNGKAFDMYLDSNAIIKNSPPPPPYVFGGEMIVGALGIPALLYACVRARRQVKARAKKRSPTN